MCRGGDVLGVFYEVLLALGVALLLVITCSIETLGREYLRTGHVPLALLERHHDPECAGNICAAPPHRSPRHGRF
jgi:hypothetical protein